MQIIDLDEYCVIKWRLTDICNYNCSYCIRKPLVAEDNHKIKEDYQKCIKALPYLIAIANKLYTIHNKPIKIDVIGGEVSIFDNLNKILYELFKVDCIHRVNITTNFWREVRYYADLCEIAARFNKQLTITASFHPESADLDDFMAKAKKIYNLLGNSFKCETVITNVNTQVQNFIDKCQEIGCHYMCEEDLLDTTKRGQSVKSIKPNYRYRVITDNGDEKYYTTRNEVIKTYGKNGIAIDTSNKLCSRDYDYVYIEQDYAIPCRRRIPIEDYELLGGPALCKYGECTLCGHMSIYDIGKI